MSMDYDVIIVGSGAGGGSVALQLAKAGKRVLIIERGRLFTDPEIGQNEKSMLIERIAHDDRQIEINGRNARLFVSGIVGGGTSIYGAALLRPSPDDFHPGKHYSKHLPDYLCDWPIDYETLRPYYDQAEDLYHVAGNHQAAPPHIASREIPYSQLPPNLEPINQRLSQSLIDQGIQPFHLPLGIDWNICLRCPTCPGYGCPNESRASSWKCCIRPAIEKHGAEIWTETEALQLQLGENGQVQSLQVLRSQTREKVEITAKLYILSAGAVSSPHLLQRSGIKDISDELGRNYMYHAGALAVGFFKRPTSAAERFIKQLGWTDDYFGTPSFEHKLGYVQALPIPGPLSIKSEAPFPVPLSAAKFLHARSMAFAGAVEDLPRRDNRVSVARDGQMRLTHRFHSYDIFRARFILKRLQKFLKKAGAVIVAGATAEKDDLHTAHQVGTCRFGNDPEKSVLDPNCRLHGVENLYVIDGSFMPTSLGVGPALTIIANSLRVSDHIIKEVL
ncbi:GMC family oxidoreductase [bacterium]|nr:GMC family oxidoreductase [bacterium]